ncbi:MAG: DUF3108 domain-containing protein [Gammaproteobacteria bacterium]|nr:DUF3108 domain-containing protein [Gammaproteobacteria bacterium]MBU1482429.1 DUF3108 domain-containing protein [Gammaproteobacteria bacterium]
MRILVALLLCCFAPSLFAAPPTSIEASYDVTTKGIKIATITEKFTRTGNHYRIESITKPVGLLALFKPDTLYVISEGDIGAQGLRPQNFVYKRSQEILKNTEANFDWSQSTVMLNDRYGQRVEPLAADTQDRLSAQYQFRYITFLRDRKEVTMHITNGSKIDTRKYVIQPKQMLTVPLGTLETLYLSTPQEEGSAWKTEIWLSVENGNFPCKITVTEDNGDKYSQVLTALSITQ